MKTLLVTGAAGFIGSCFSGLALEAGYRVVALDALTYAGHRENLAHLARFEREGRFELVVGNIVETPRVLELLRRHQPDAIVNFAAESHVDRSIDAPSAFLETNISGVFSLLNAALEHWKGLAPAPTEGFRFLQVSTDEVYGSLGSEGRFSEETAYAPNSPYSASKASGDFLVRAWHHTFGLPTLTTNCSNNYGPRQFPEKLIPHMILSALAGRPLPVYGDGGNIRDWIHVEDHCAGILLALEKGRPGATYCFGGDAERSNLAITRAICRELDGLRPRGDGKPHESAIRFVTDRPGHDRRYAIDDRRARTELGFERRYAFEKGLAGMVRWYLENERWTQAVMGSNGLARQGLGPGTGKNT